MATVFMRTLKEKQSRPGVPLPKPWRRAIQLMDYSLAQNQVCDNSEKIDLLGKQLFGDLWTPRDSKPSE